MAKNAMTNRQAFQRMLRPSQGRNEQQKIQWMLERKLMEISMNRFQWSGVEDIGLNVRWMEMALCFTALSVFQENPVKEQDVFGKQYEALRGYPGIGLSRTGDPTSFWVYKMDQSTPEEVKAKDCVPIWANFMRIPDWDIIEIYARRMANIDQTIDINIKQLRHPKVLKTTPNTSLSINNLRQQLDEGASAVEIDVSSVDPADAIEVLDFELDPNQLINTHIMRTREWAECMTMLGINNSNQDKKERLTAAETAGNDDVIATIRETNLKARRIACDQINKRFDLDISVDYTTDMKTAITKDVGGDGDQVTDPNAAPAEKVGA